MEEKVKNGSDEPVKAPNVENKKQKLTYEQLEAYTSQLVQQAQALAKKNKELQSEVLNLYNQMGMQEAGLAIKCIEMSDKFSPEFIQKNTKRVEEFLDPTKEEPSEPKVPDLKVAKE